MEFSAILPISGHLSRVPEHLEDEDLLVAYHRMINSPCDPPHVTYMTSVGLLLKLMKGTKRLWKRGKIPLPTDDGVQYLTQFWNYYTPCAMRELGREYWTPERLHNTAVEVNKICVQISPSILRDLDSHPLRPPRFANEFVEFDKDFLVKVIEYHKSLERPPETFSSDKILIEDSSKLSDYLELIETLSHLPREICPNCKGRRQIYCGDCQGIRMEEASKFLPAKISLPINVVLLLHWRESLHKCTGIHAAVLSEENTVECIRWPKEDHEEEHPGWDEIVRQLDSDRDVLLYPYDDAVSAELYDWRISDSPSSSHSFDKKRLIVLEGSWEGAKTMANRITTIRERLSLPPLPSVTLPSNITSHYWRLQHMGSGAVSTIEAIAHVISLIDQSNSPHKSSPSHQIGSPTDTLLLLFNLQRHRMLSNVQQGAKVPMAIAASNNTGYSTSWASIIANAFSDREV